MSHTLSIRQRFTRFLTRLGGLRAHFLRAGGDVSRETDPRNARYDRQTLEIIDRVMDREALGVDGGAHRGAFLRELLRRAPRVAHHAFEPLPDFAGFLERRFPEARVHRAALGKAPDRARFVHVRNDPGYSGLRQRDYDRPDPELDSLDVDVVRLDDVLAADDRPALIKLDLEGGEFDALLGARHTIERCRPVIIFEAGERSSGHYGVTAESFFDWFSDLAYGVSTPGDWLAGGEAYGRAAFLEAYREEFYFVAFPLENVAPVQVSETQASETQATETAPGN